MLSTALAGTLTLCLPDLINFIAIGEVAGHYAIDFLFESFNLSTTNFFLAFFFSTRLKFATLRVLAIGLSSTRIGGRELSLFIGRSKKISLKISTSTIWLLFKANFLILID